MSNWGGYALAASLYLFAKDQTSNDDPSMLVDFEEESKLLELMIAKYGIVDGVSASPVAKVDGLLFDLDHQKIILDINTLARS